MLSETTFEIQAALHAVSTTFEKLLRRISSSFDEGEELSTEIENCVIFIENTLLNRSCYEESEMVIIFECVYEFLKDDSPRTTILRSKEIIVQTFFKVIHKLFESRELILADALLHVSEILGQKHQYKFAVEYASKSLLIRTRIVGLLDDCVAATHDALALFHSKLGNHFNSKKSLKISYHIRSELYGEYSISVSNVELLMGTVDVNSFAYDSAYMHFYKSYFIRKILLGNNHDLTLAASLLAKKYRFLRGERLFSKLELSNQIDYLNWKSYDSSKDEYLVCVLISRFPIDEVLPLSRLRYLIVNCLSSSIQRNLQRSDVDVRVGHLIELLVPSLADILPGTNIHDAKEKDYNRILSGERPSSHNEIFPKTSPQVVSITTSPFKNQKSSTLSMALQIREDKWNVESASVAEDVAVQSDFELKEVVTNEGIAEACQGNGDSPFENTWGLSRDSAGMVFRFRPSLRDVITYTKLPMCVYGSLFLILKNLGVKIAEVETVERTIPLPPSLPSQWPPLASNESKVVAPSSLNNKATINEVENISGTIWDFDISEIIPVSFAACSLQIHLSHRISVRYLFCSKILIVKLKTRIRNYAKWTSMKII